MYQYPYGNAQQLNLDWVLSKIQELEAGATAVNIEEVANALVSASFDAGASYRRYDYCFYNGKLYRALNDTTGAFNPADWLEVVIGDDIPVLTRLLNAVDTSLTSLQTTVGNQGNDITNLKNTAVTNVKYASGYLKKTINGADTDIIEVEDTPTNNSAKLPSSKAIYNLNDTVNDLQGQITANVETSTTASRAYTVGEYLVLNGTLYKVTANIANGGTITVNTNVVATDTGAELKTAMNFPVYVSGGALVEITDGTWGFIDTGISASTYALLAAYVWLETNVCTRISNLTTGDNNYRVQILQATTGNVVTSGSHRLYYVYMNRSDLTTRVI